MTRTEELLALADAASEPRITGSLPEYERHHVSIKEFIAACNPETIKQLIALVRLQHETLLELEPYIPARVVAIEAFNKFERGES